ncbi:unnamed protein product [Meganyctiphanes norvegica]|uniref:14 kDa phosphohistidine phosphatase n=1 Tax=Meganyctiphanes norvegica TaxID=48144 RepID=A0AAV2PQW1_MEGNR
MASALLQAVEPVDIDTGKFKYILIKVEEGDDSKFIVRGYSWAEWHNNIYDKVAPELEGQGLKCSCVGGGKIKHSSEDKTILVFGESTGFGKADHSVSVNVIKSKYNDYDVKIDE